MTTATITAVFDDVGAAERAAEALATRVGGVRGRVHRASGADTGTGLRDLAVPQDDLDAYAEALRRGSAVVSATVPEERLDRAADVLEAFGAVDFDAREAEWRREGWAARSGSAPRADGAAPERPGSCEQVIPLIEERLRVGKREVGHGRVRVRSRVVEVPAEEQVTLRDTHVAIERRTVDRPAADDELVFHDRSIEAQETTEEAVVGKEARVREEIVLRKRPEERTETVSDRVRRTEVDVEDGRHAAGGAGVSPGERR